MSMGSSRQLLSVRKQEVTNPFSTLFTQDDSGRYSYTVNSGYVLGSNSHLVHGEIPYAVSQSGDHQQMSSVCPESCII